MAKHLTTTVDEFISAVRKAVFSPRVWKLVNRREWHLRPSPFIAGMFPRKDMEVFRQILLAAGFGPCRLRHGSLMGHCMSLDYETKEGYLVNRQFPYIVVGEKGSILYAATGWLDALFRLVLSHYGETLSILSAQVIGLVRRSYRRNGIVLSPYSRSRSQLLFGSGVKEIVASKELLAMETVISQQLFALNRHYWLETTNPDGEQF